MCLNVRLCSAGSDIAIITSGHSTENLFSTDSYQIHFQALRASEVFLSFGIGVATDVIRIVDQSRNKSSIFQKRSVEIKLLLIEIGCRNTEDVFSVTDILLKGFKNPLFDIAGGQFGPIHSFDFRDAKLESY